MELNHCALLEVAHIQGLEIGFSAVNVKSGITAVVLAYQIPQLAKMTLSMLATFANSHASCHTVVIQTEIFTLAYTVEIVSIMIMLSMIK